MAATRKMSTCDVFFFTHESGSTCGPEHVWSHTWAWHACGCLSNPGSISRVLDSQNTCGRISLLFAFLLVLFTVFIVLLPSSVLSRHHPPHQLLLHPPLHLRLSSPCPLVQVSLGNRSFCKALRWVEAVSRPCLGCHCLTVFHSVFFVFLLLTCPLCFEACQVCLWLTTPKKTNYGPASCGSFQEEPRWPIMIWCQGFTKRNTVTLVVEVVWSAKLLFLCLEDIVWRLFDVAYQVGSEWS